MQPVVEIDAQGHLSRAEQRVPSGQGFDDAGEWNRLAVLPPQVYDQTPILDVDHGSRPRQLITAFGGGQEPPQRIQGDQRLSRRREPAGATLFELLDGLASRLCAGSQRMQSVTNERQPAFTGIPLGQHLFQLAPDCLRHGIDQRNARRAPWSDPHFVVQPARESLAANFRSSEMPEPLQAVA